jgi:hypothetical protein
MFPCLLQSLALEAAPRHWQHISRCKKGIRVYRKGLKARLLETAAARVVAACVGGGAEASRTKEAESIRAGGSGGRLVERSGGAREPRVLYHLLSVRSRI